MNDDERDVNIHFIPFKKIFEYLSSFPLLAPTKKCDKFETLKQM